MTAVLIVEDDTPALRLLGWGLIDAGFQVGAASSADDACARLETFAAQVVVFNTLALSPEGRRAAFAQLRAAAPHIKIIDLRPDGSPDSGADACVASPVKVSEVVAQINAWVS